MSTATFFNICWITFHFEEFQSAAIGGKMNLAKWQQTSKETITGANTGAQCEWSLSVCDCICDYLFQRYHPHYVMGDIKKSQTQTKVISVNGT